MAKRVSKHDMVSLQKDLAKKVWANKKLRKEILSDPKKNVEKVLGVSFDENAKVQVIDQAEENVYYFVLPSHLSYYGKNLTKEQLEKIACGIFFDKSIEILGLKQHNQD